MNGNAILLVEDNEDDAELAMRAFRASPVPSDIRLARDGGDALAQLFGHDDSAPQPALPALVLLDLKLPGFDGFEVLRRIRGDPRTRTLPVVIFTSSTEQSDLSSCYRLGANSYIRKPGSLGDLVAAAHQIAAYWLQLNERPERW